MSKAYLVLQNGAVFAGERIGAAADAVGELVFTTGVCGCIETLTDPVCFGQIVVQTFPLIGNYGFIAADAASPRSMLRGYVVRELCETPSNFRCERTLGDYLTEQGIPGICGIDTREVTRTLRSQGVMNAAIVSEVTPELTARLAEYAVKDAVRSVASQTTEAFPAEGERKFTVAMPDYGAAAGIVRELTRRGCEVISFPAETPADGLLACGADGVMLPDGPGDPAENAAAVEAVRGLLGKLPIFGVGLGHQLLALAAGAKTVKLKFGHRGVNQPVRELLGCGKTHITSQNHGYAVESGSVKAAGGVISYENANDGTCEGIVWSELNAASVQFRPDAAFGTHETCRLFDGFTDAMAKRGK